MEISQCNHKSLYFNYQWEIGENLIQPALIFTCSMSDFFIEDGLDNLRGMGLGYNSANIHNINGRYLAKRPERILQCLPPDWGDGMG